MKTAFDQICEKRVISVIKQFVLFKKIISKNKARIVYAEVFSAKSVHTKWAEMRIQNELTLHRAW